MQNKKPFPNRWIFLRGLTRSAFHWLGFENEFKSFFKSEQTFCPELAGNGLLFEELSTTEIDQAVHQLRNQIQFDKSQLGLFSISMGGMIATRWAEMFPDEVSHLVLVNSSFSSLSPFYQRLRPSHYPSIVENFLISNPQKMEEFIMSVTSNDETKWKPFLEKIITFQKNHPVSLANFVRQLKLSGQTEFKQKPTAEILILNSLKDRLVSHKCSEAIAKNWKASIETHPTAGHDLPLDDANWVLNKIKENF
jgi:pimeloyl-ACP methyl ester carboxylesterase